MVELVSSYFPKLSEDQLDKLSALIPLYAEWNEQINVVSRKDIENLEERHILHSLLLAKFITFNANASVLDLGCGGGFPGIPLAILFPETQFFLIDARAKKIKVVEAIATELGLDNISYAHGRVEEIKGVKFDFVITRAVAKLEVLMSWCRKLISKKHSHPMPNGLIALKGGDLAEEIAALGKQDYVEEHKASKYFSEPFFEEKSIVYVQG